jgi:hypothetical protein
MSRWSQDASRPGLDRGCPVGVGAETRNETSNHGPDVVGDEPIWTVGDHLVIPDRQVMARWVTDK